MTNQFIILLPAFCNQILTLVKYNTQENCSVLCVALDSCCSTQAWPLLKLSYFKILRKESLQQDKQLMYNETLRRVNVTIVAVKKR